MRAALYMSRKGERTHGLSTLRTRSETRRQDVARPIRLLSGHLAAYLHVFAVEATFRAHLDVLIQAALKP